MHHHTSTLTAIVAILAAVTGLWAEDDYLTAKPEDLTWFRDARFGLFVHWGPVSLMGTEIGWSRGGERRGIGGTGQIPVEVYDSLYQRFNPTAFDAREWIRIARDAGMRYLVFTTKHHDGFCEFDSALTDYDIMASPFGRDIVAELAAACHEAGLRLGFYYSPVDWHHPDYRTERHTQYIRYLHGQLRELCTNYGQVDVIWFDGLGGTVEDWDSKPLFQMISTLQPGVLINNRAGLPGDFDTPEQTIGRFQLDRPWESCITICNQWAWKPDDRLKSLTECIATLVRCAGGDGNLLFNVGPMPDGRIEPRQVERLREMGDWLRVHGESIYGTRGGPYKPGPWGVSTRRGRFVYLHILDWQGAETLKLPPLPAKVLRASRLDGGTVEARWSEDGLEVTVDSREPIDTVVRLELDAPATDLAPIATYASGSLARDKPVTASNTFQNNPAYGPDKALDDDPDTRWATDWGTHEAWLEIDLGAEQRLGRAAILEAIPRVEAFELQRRVGDAWVTFHAGARIGERLEISFEPIDARWVRLHITKASEGPTLWEVQLFAP